MGQNHAMPFIIRTAAHEEAPHISSSRIRLVIGALELHIWENRFFFCFLYFLLIKDTICGKVEKSKRPFAYKWYKKSTINHISAI